MRRSIYLSIILLLSIAQYTRSQSSGKADGYLDKLSYRAGDTVTFFINTQLLKVGKITGSLFLYAPDGSIAGQIDSIDMAPQSIKNTEPWKNGYGYTASGRKWVVPSTVKSGYYLLKNPKINPNLSVPIIIKGDNQIADITIICPTNTINAYTNSGGKSLYIANSSDTIPSTTVSFLRPLTYSAGFFSGFTDWIYGKNYTVNVISDMDMDEYSEVEHAKLVIIIGHSEYWTRQARINFDKFVDSGKNALVLSGNTMWWQVRYSNDNFISGLPVEDKTIMTCHKNSGPKYDDDLIGDPLLKTYNWTNPLLKYPVLGSIGSDFPHGGYGVQLSAKSNPPACDYGGFNGMKVSLPSSPLLNGLYSVGAVISFANGEYDGSPMKKNSNGAVLLDSNGIPQLDDSILNFCKAEMIAYDQTTAPNYKSVRYCPIMVFQKTSVSGKIINVNSDRWCSDIGMGGNTFTTTACPTISITPDSLITPITENMINLLLTNANVFTSLPPSSPSCIYPPPQNPTTGCFNSNDIVNILNVYPNPTKGIIKLNIGQLNNAQVNIYNVLGEIIYQHTITSSGLDIDLTAQSNGVYFIKLMSDQGSVNKKIVINH